MTFEEEYESLVSLLESKANRLLTEAEKSYIFEGVQDPNFSENVKFLLTIKG